MDKVKLVEHFIKHIEAELLQLEISSKATRDEATHEESKPENQYDTRALETGYLVKAQSKRLLDVREILSAFKFTSIKNFTNLDPIGVTALIELEMNGKTNFFYFMPFGGGTTIEFEGIRIQVLTPTSPLGEALVGLKVGDYATIENGSKITEYEVLSIK